MLEFAYVAEGEARPVDDAGVVELVEIDRIPLADEARERPEIDLVPSGECHGGRLAHELRQAFFQSHVQVESAVQESATRAARSILQIGRASCRERGENSVGADHGQEKKTINNR